MFTILKGLLIFGYMVVITLACIAVWTFSYFAIYGIVAAILIQVSYYIVDKLEDHEYGFNEPD